MKTKKKLRDSYSVIKEENTKLRKALMMFTDMKSSAFPYGEMIEMHGGNGDGNYYCVYNRKTILKARELLKKLDEIQNITST